MHIITLKYHSFLRGYKALPSFVQLVWCLYSHNSVTTYPRPDNEWIRVCLFEQDCVLCLQLACVRSIHKAADVSYYIVLLDNTTSDNNCCIPSWNIFVSHQYENFTHDKCSKQFELTSYTAVNWSQDLSGCYRGIVISGQKSRN